jgi:hypothetical protein
MSAFRLNEQLELVKIRTYRQWFQLSAIVNLILLGSLIYASVLGPTIREVIKYVPFHSINEHDIQPSDSTVLAELMKEGCVLPTVAVAQAKIESGNYKSEVCVKNKNMFGIRYHKCQFVSGQNLNHATYNSFRDNIKCYIHVQNRYLTNIDGVYAESPVYISTLKSLKK